MPRNHWYCSSRLLPSDTETVVLDAKRSRKSRTSTLSRKRCSSWLHEDRDMPSTSVSISPPQLLDGGFVQAIQSYLDPCWWEPWLPRILTGSMPAVRRQRFLAKIKRLVVQESWLLFIFRYGALSY